MTGILSWLKARDLTEIVLGGVVGFLATGAFFAVIQERASDMMNDRAMENAQLQVADALDEANKFRASLECTAATPDGCKCWGPRL